MMQTYSERRKNSEILGFMTEKVKQAIEKTISRILSTVANVEYLINTVGAASVANGTRYEDINEATYRQYWDQILTIVLSDVNQDTSSTSFFQYVDSVLQRYRVVLSLRLT
jgi:hypothetical protein